MQHDIQKELRFGKSEQMLEDHQMAVTADWQEFRQTLDNAQKDCLIKLDQTLLLSQMRVDVVDFGERIGDGKSHRGSLQCLRVGIPGWRR